MDGMMAKHLNITWPTRHWSASNAYQMVRTENEKEIHISFMPGGLRHGVGHILTRADARLLARRIMQCLEATK